MCRTRLRDSVGKITTYILMDNEHNNLTIHADELKQAMRSNKITVTNLTLTSDNRLIMNLDSIYAELTRGAVNKLIDIANKDHKVGLSFKTVPNLESILSRARISGINTGKLPNDLYYVVDNSNIIVFSDLHIRLPRNSNNLFKRSCFKNIDFSGIDMSPVVEARYMFSGCVLESLVI